MAPRPPILATWALEIHDGGRVRLDAPNPVFIEASRDGVRRVRGAGIPADWILRPSRSSRGFVLEPEGAADPEVEQGRTTHLPGESAAWGPVACLLRDGRRFSFVLEADEAGRAWFGLRHWEVPGDYAAAYRDPGGWVVGTTPAGTCLEAAPALWVLFAAEVSAHLDGA